MSVGYQGSKIVVVDDEEVVRNSFRDQLEDLGYLVSAADCGKDAVELIKSEIPDLLITDLRMPEMNGLELIRVVKSIAPDLPVIVISGAGVLSDAVDALREGAYDYLVKPLGGLHILEHAVEQALENARLIRENRRYQEHLETLVNERTSDLKKSNRKLENLNVRLEKIVETTKGFTGCADVSSISARILEEFADHMSASGGSFYFVEEGGLRMINTLDPGHALDFIPFPLVQESVFNRVLECGEPLLIEDVEATEGTRSSGWSEYKNGSVLAFALPNESGEAMALLTLHSKETPPFIEQDKEVGAILASHSCEAIRAIQTTETLRESERRFRELADLLPLMVFETNSEGRLTYFNRKTTERLGYSSGELSEKKLIKLVPPSQREKVIFNSAKVVQEGQERAEGTEYKAREKNGAEFPVLTYSAPIVVNGVSQGMRAAMIDISLIKKQQDQIYKHAYFDSLTNLPNRFLTLDRLSQQIKDAQRNGSQIAVLFLDLDDFKKVNDTLGHAVGDKLLVMAAERLTKVLRQGDTVARLGGDEFVILLHDLESAAEARPVVNNLLDLFRTPFVLDGRELLLTASFGIAVYPLDGETPDELLQKADSAMYYSKGSGRNTYSYFTEDMNKAATRRLQLEEKIYGVLERNELSVVYQPLVAIDDKSIIGVEALLRWENPEFGSVGPTEFIPLMEQSGQIEAVGKYVITQALSFVSEAKKSLPEFKIAINMSPRQFRDPGLVSFLREGLNKYKLDGSELELEITEGLLIDSTPQVNEMLKLISEMGISISLDDFGTGYSSLSYLRQYPFNTLKIDRSFIRDVAAKPADRELVNTIVAMGHNLGIKVIAEGVEDESQLKVLKEIGCEFAQGYYFSKPAPADVISKLFK